MFWGHQYVALNIDVFGLRTWGGMAPKWRAPLWDDDHRNLYQYDHELPTTKKSYPPKLTNRNNKVLKNATQSLRPSSTAGPAVPPPLPRQQFCALPFQLF
jgi:hypothetical protein